MRRIIALLIVVFLLVTLMPMVAFAADIVIDLSVKGESTTYKIEHANVTIINTDSGPFYDINGYSNISILCEGYANLTLDGIKIDNSGIHGLSALRFTNAGNTLNLIGDSVLKAGTNVAGVWGAGAAELEISGSGSLEAYGGENSAGIGGGAAGDGGYITIKSGTVSAQGGYKGAGIGGGYSGNGGNITIEGGTVTATGGVYGAGIGGGEKGDAIGGDGGNITISGGVVTAIGQNYGAGIGGGNGGIGGEILIEGGVVYAQCTGRYGAGIGGGNNDGAIIPTGGVITIGGGDVTALGGGTAAGIGGGKHGGGGSTQISGGEVEAIGGENGAGIGGGESGDGGEINIINGNVKAMGGDNGSGIGGGWTAHGGEISISNAVVDAAGGQNAAGIGGGYSGDGGDISISNATIDAQGGPNAAGIGGGSGGHGGKIAILSGNINAVGNDDGAGIGGGKNGDGGIISIYNGYVVATGGEYSAGIGGGSGGDGGEISINNGSVFARKGAGGKHDIGEGQSGVSTTLKISGDAGVFLYNDECATPTTMHTHFSMTYVENGKLHGIEVPSGWGAGGAYIVACTLSYSANGGSGSVAGTITLHKGGVTSAAPPGNLSNGLLAMVQWNTSRYGKGYGYFPGGDVVVTQNTTLYAIWKERDVNSVALSQNKMKMTKFQKVRLGVTVSPANATNDVVWHSTKTDVAVVDQRGVVTAIGDGSAMIVAEADGVRDTCEVIVKEKEEVALALIPTNVVLDVGDALTIIAELTGDAAIEWESTNPDVATVNSSGYVRAISEGVTVIIARADEVYDVCGVAVDYFDEGYAGDKDDADETVNKDHDAENQTQSEGAGTRFPWWWIPISIFGLGLVGMGAWVVLLRRR